MALPDRMGTLPFYHADQPDDYGAKVESSAVLKANFDSQAVALLETLNGVIDALNSILEDASGADCIKRYNGDGMGGTVQAAIASIVAAGTGTLPPDGSITDAKLETDIKVGSLADLLTTAKDSAVAAINELTESFVTGGDSHNHTEGAGAQIPAAGIADTAVTNDKIAINAVTTTKILDANVTKAKLSADQQEVYCCAQRTTSQSSGNIEFNAADKSDALNMHNPSSNSDRIVVPYDGIYLAVLNASIDAVVGDNLIQLSASSTTYSPTWYRSWIKLGTGEADPVGMSVSGLFKLAANDYIRGYSTSDITSSGAELAVTKIG